VSSYTACHKTTLMLHISATPVSSSYNDKSLWQSEDMADKDLHIATSICKVFHKKQNLDFLKCIFGKLQTICNKNYSVCTWKMYIRLPLKTSARTIYIICRHIFNITSKQNRTQHSIQLIIKLWIMLYSCIWPTCWVWFPATALSCNNSGQWASCSHTSASITK